MDIHQQSLITRAIWRLQSDHLLPCLEVFSFSAASVLHWLIVRNSLQDCFVCHEEQKLHCWEILFRFNFSLWTHVSRLAAPFQDSNHDKRPMNGSFYAALCVHSKASVYSARFPSEERELLMHKATIIPTWINRLNIVAHGDVHEMKARYSAIYIQIMVVLYITISLLNIV